jgi:hypothetical protein
MYKPAVDLKGTIASPISRGQGASNNTSPVVKGIIRTAGSYTPTKSVSFLSSKDIKPGENMQRHLSPDPTEPNHPGIEAICFRIVKRKHSDVARDPSRPFCDMRTELKIEKDMNPRIFTRKIPRNPVYPCPPPPPNTPTGAGSQPNIETLAMELHVALTKIKVPSLYYLRSPTPPNSTTLSPGPVAKSAFASVDDGSPIQPLSMYPPTPPPSGRRIISIQEASQPGLESSFRYG